MNLAILNALIRDYVDPAVLTTHARSGAAAGMFSVAKYEGGTVHEWINESAYGADAQFIGEGGAPPAITWPTIRRAQKAYAGSWQTTRQITGEVRSALGTNGIETAVTKVMQGLMKSMQGTLDTLAVLELTTNIDSTANGSANAYGLVRVANNWDSAVQNVGGIALVEAHLQNAYDAFRTGFREGRADLGSMFIASNVTQQRAYTDFLGVGPASALPLIMALDPESGRFDVGRVKPSISFNGLPWFTVDTLPVGDIFILDASQMKVRFKQPPLIEALGKTGYPETWMGVSEFEFFYHDPGLAARITNLA